MNNLDNNYQNLVSRIGETYQFSRGRAFSAVNSEMLYAYWQIGKDIVEFEQKGLQKAEYGKQLLENLAKDLCTQYMVKALAEVTFNT